MAESTQETIYFAHPIPTYDTPRERSAVAQIKATFPTAIINNPAKLPGRDMQFFLKQVELADRVVFMTNQNGIIGRGVYREVSFAQRLEKPVLFLDPDQNIFTDTFRLKVIDKDDWKHYATVEVS